MWISQPTDFDELELDPLVPASGGPLWIATQGYLVNAIDISTATYVGQLLRRESNTRTLSALRGDYAILLVAPERNWYWLHRSATGGRSAFVARSRSRMALASQAHLIAALPEVSRSPDPAYTASMLGLRLVPPIGHTPFESVRELAAGETAEITHGDIQFRGSLAECSRPGRHQTTDQWVDDFREHFERAVAETLPLEGEPGIMLSGGLDSGPVAAIAARRLARSGRRVTVTSWALPELPDADERAYIEQIGAWIKARMQVFDADHLLPFSEIYVTAEGPLFNAFDPAVRACYEAARANDCKVILTGGAGDRLYPNPRWLMYDQLRRRELGQFGHTMAAGLQSTRAFRRKLYPALRYLAKRLLVGSVNRAQPPPEWLTARAREVFEQNTGAAFSDSKHPHPEYLRRLTGNWLAGHSAAENETAERYGLSRRDPFLNRELVNLMLDMPFSMTFRNGQVKWQMRQMMRQDNALPESIIEKGRTGLLGSFFNAGFEAARRTMTKILEEDDSWREWVEPAFVEKAMSAHDCTDQHKLVAARCVGFALWRREVEQLRFQTLSDT